MEPTGPRRYTGVMRRILTLFTIAAAALTGACASTGAVPRPFPQPGGAPSQADVPAPLVDPAPVPETKPSVDAYALTGTALSLRGSPYRNGGADPNGFDCSGFTQYVFGHHGIMLPRNVKEQFATGQAVKADEIVPGDLIFFTTVGPGASHVGIALGGDAFVHAPSSTGVVRVEHLSAAYWSQRFIGARRVSWSQSIGFDPL
jgi:cell wall-associated NlpC family hydrolase